MIDFFNATIAADPARAGRIGYYAVTIPGPGPAAQKAGEIPVEDTVRGGGPGQVPGPGSSSEDEEATS